MSATVLASEKVVVITGASRGIGYYLALCLAERGYIVCATCRRKEDLGKFKKFTKKFPNLFAYQLDVTSDKSVKTSIKEILIRHKKIDVLVNNAASLLFGPLETVSLQQLKEQYDVNLFGVIRVIQAVLPSMRKHKTGHILFMGSTSGVHCQPMYGAYASTKYAIEAIASSLASNLLFWKIRVSIIENSATCTGLTSKSLKMGTRFRPQTNPYKQYMKSSLQFLREIASQGQAPEIAAEAIAKVIDTPDPSLRKFITKYAKTIFNKELKDPAGKDWLKKAQDELKWFELKLNTSLRNI